MGNLIDGKADVVERPLLLVAHHIRLVLLGHWYLAGDGNAAVLEKCLKNRWKVLSTHHHMTLSSATSRDLDVELGVHRRRVCNGESWMRKISKIFTIAHFPSTNLPTMNCWLCEELWKSGLGALAFELMSVVAVQGRVRSGERVTFFRPTHSIHESNRILEISGIQ